MTRLFVCMKIDHWGHRSARDGGWLQKNVVPGEAKPFCWWTVQCGGIRVLYGDLTLGDAEQGPAE